VLRFTHTPSFLGTWVGSLRLRGADAFEWKLAVINESAIACSISSSSFDLVGARYKISISLLQSDSGATHLYHGSRHEGQAVFVPFVTLLIHGSDKLTSLLGRTRWRSCSPNSPFPSGPIIVVTRRIHFHRWINRHCQCPFQDFFLILLFLFLSLDLF
jgi:hypothetical protein